MDEAEKNHDEHLNKLMRRIQKANVHLNAEKLKYKRQEVKFAGYILSAKGHTADPEKIRAITEMEYPTNVSELRRFCGMVNYLAKYVQDLATLMEPLHQLTRKDSLCTTAVETYGEHMGSPCDPHMFPIRSPYVRHMRKISKTTKSYYICGPYVV